MGKEGAGIRTSSAGIRLKSTINGRPHVDEISVIMALSRIGQVQSIKLDLNSVSEELLGEGKVEIDRGAAWKLWEGKGEEHERFGEYSLKDAELNAKLFESTLALEVQLCQLVGMTLPEASRATTGQMVEFLLEKKSFEAGKAIPPKPSFDSVSARMEQQIQGGLVKLPKMGLVEKVAVFDFRSLYPSIIVSHNIDPETITKEKGAYESPTGTRFAKTGKGLIPAVLNEILEARFKAKDQLKRMKKDGREGAREFHELDARQTALKILANSFYGYLGYSRARWYSRECAEAVTAWARRYITSVMDEAEKAGFEVVYGDTDSIFLKYGSKEEVLRFQRDVNESLPEKMFLELEDFYPRALFVGKKQGEVGAKKKYAMINEKGQIKIRGFELVRRDWSGIARKTQKKVLEILLKEGDEKKAIRLVEKTVGELKEGRVPLEELVIHTQLGKNPSEYEVASPEVSAYRKAVKAGKQLAENHLVSFVITRNGKTISEKAFTIEMAEDYDADYYIQNQLLPAVLKILQGFGYAKKDLLDGNKQTALFHY